LLNSKVYLTIRTYSKKKVERTNIVVMVNLQIVIITEILETDKIDWL